MTVINKFYTTGMFDGSRRFHASLIKLITNTSALYCFLPYATTSPTTLANMQTFFPLADPTSHNILATTENCSNFFLMRYFSLLIPEVFNSSRIHESSYALTVVTVHEYFCPEHFLSKSLLSAFAFIVPN